MQKTKLGISVGLLGAAIYFAGFFGGILAAVIMAGYVLLFEENGWLKRTAVKAVALLLFFSALTALINLIPDAVKLIDSIFAIFGSSFRIVVLTNIITAVVNLINFVKTILFIGLGFKALNQGTIIISVIDSLIDKYMR